MKITAATVFSLMFVSSLAAAAGLGDTAVDIEREWMHGYKKVYPAGLGSNSVAIGSSRRNSFEYTTGIVGNCFGKPEHIGRIDGEATELFGITNQKFYKGVKGLFPKDYTPIACYTKNGQTNVDIFTFTSKPLTKKPSIKESMAYKPTGMNHPVGTFGLIVDHYIDDKNKVAHFILFLGLPEEVDLVGMHKVTCKNLFRSEDEEHIAPKAVITHDGNIYKTTQDANAYRDMGRCQDLFNAMQDDSAHRRARAAHDAGKYTFWPEGTRVTVTKGNVDSDLFVMAKDSKGHTGCIAAAWLQK
jgi:hypothetical protein